MQSRYLAIAVFFVLVGWIGWKDKRTLRSKIKYYGAMFLEGMAGGLIVDSVGVNVGYYYFPRQPLYSADYWLIVVPCWGVFGLLLNCLWDWFGKDKFLRSMAVAVAPLFVFYEGSNLATGSWVYTVPLYVVMLGWIPLGWVFAGCNKRRRVVFKVEEWRSQFDGMGVHDRLARGVLGGLKCLLVVVMFPLLLVAVVKYLGNLHTVVKAGATAGNYRDYTKMMVKMWLAMS